MKIHRTVAVVLTPDEIAEMIKDHLAKEGFEVRNVDFKVSSHIEGYGQGEHEVKSFDGCKVACDVAMERNDE